VCVCAHHGHGLRVEHPLGGEGGEVGQVGQNVDHRHDGQGDDDGAGKVSEGETHTRTHTLSRTDY